MDSSCPLRRTLTTSLPTVVVTPPAEMDTERSKQLRRSNATYFDRESIAGSLSETSIDENTETERNVSGTRNPIVASPPVPFGQAGIDIAESYGTSYQPEHAAATSKAFRLAPALTDEQGVSLSPHEDTKLPIPKQPYVQKPRYYSGASAQPGPSSSSNQSHDESASMSKPLPQKKAQQGRYYSHALSKEDKDALAVGELNHNLKEWGIEDLIRFEESRKELFPKGMLKMEDTVEKRQKEREVLKQEIAELKDEAKESNESSLFLNPSPTSSPSISPPMVPQQVYLSPKIRTNSAPVSPLLYPLTEEFTESLSNGLHEQARLRNASTGDYFSTSHARRTSQLSQASGHSRNSILIRSPLSSEARPYSARAEVTFDTFLSQHVSGKGEAYRGAANAMKEMIEAVDGQQTKQPKGLQAERLSKVPSMPSLRKRKSKADLI